ncbi:hypothetical protein ACA910_008311 [Epithemia clementina (nom. ined.)]
MLAMSSLFMEHGHLIDQVLELLLVLENALEEPPTKHPPPRQSCKPLVTAESKQMHCAKGKMCKRWYMLCQGPLVIYNSKKGGVEQALCNLPGINLCCINH